MLEKENLTNQSEVLKNIFESFTFSRRKGTICEVGGRYADWPKITDIMHIVLPRKACPSVSLTIIGKSKSSFPDFLIFSIFIVSDFHNVTHNAICILFIVFTADIKDCLRLPLMLLVVQ